MKSSRSTAQMLCRFTGFVLIAILGVGSAAGAAQGIHKKKRLSLSTVTMFGPNASGNGLEWVTQAQGLFKQQGLNLTLVNSGANAGVQIAALISGSAQFLQISAATAISAAASGAPVRAVIQTNQGGPQSLLVTQTFATAHNIPSAGNTMNQAIAQFKALKGTHMNIGVSTLTNASYFYILALASKYGITVGSAPNSSADINVMAEGGTAATNAAAFQAGKVDGIVAGPPNTVIASPANIGIVLSAIPPISQVPGYMDTTIQMIQQHPDTVQAAVNAMTLGLAYMHSHPVQAGKDFENVLAQNGVTNPGLLQITWEQERPSWHTPNFSKKDFQELIAIDNIATTTPITIPYSQFAYLRFVASALKTYKNLKFN